MSNLRACACARAHVLQKVLRQLGQTDGESACKKQPGHRTFHLGARARILHLVVRAVALVLRRGLEHIKVHRALPPAPAAAAAAAAGADLEDARGVAAAVAVVRRGPHRGEVVVEQHAEALHAQLVRAQDVAHAVRLEELAHDARAEGVPRAARGGQRVRG
jgi:hypothetical protein